MVGRGNNIDCQEDSSGCRAEIQLMCIRYQQVHSLDGNMYHENLARTLEYLKIVTFLECRIHGEVHYGSLGSLYMLSASNHIRHGVTSEATCGKCNGQLPTVQTSGIDQNGS